MLMCLWLQMFNCISEGTRVLRSQTKSGMKYKALYHFFCSTSVHLQVNLNHLTTSALNLKRLFKQLSTRTLVLPL